ncbi:MAG: DNA gyrase inhibitor YacG [Candidatus Dasytiphilus stammeri]
MNKRMKVQCPICSKPIIWNQDNMWRPFCSNHCKLIDLDEWLNERKCLYIPDETNHEN